MDTSFADITPLWDLSQANTFSQLADDDFLALLQKQFPASSSPTLNISGDFATHSIDPQDISRFSLPGFTPPSEDSSPSPPRNGDKQRDDDDDDGYNDRSDLKRKASEDDLEEGPNSKTQHTSSNNKKNGSNSRRKSGGQTKDEGRLMKRKEQNRAAQRAFRERKEKHVKDLEDKVAALEARSEAAENENVNLRDLLARLQSENMALKDTSFTFQVPKNGQSSTSLQSSSMLSPPAPTSYTSSFTKSPPKAANNKYTNPLDLSSLQAFDPSVLDLLDQPAEPTATSDASTMDHDFGFRREGGYLTSNLTTIAHNSQYFSLASLFDSTPTPSPPNVNDSHATSPNSFNFDMNNFSSWASPTDSTDTGTLDDLFGNYLSPVNGLGGVNALGHTNGSSPSSSISPIVHHSGLNNMHSPTNSTSSSESPGSDPSLFGTPRDGNSSASESETGHNGGKCPGNKSKCTEHMAAEGMSPFVTQSSLSRKELPDMPFGPVVACQGSSSFPKTSKSDQNIEVLTAWRTITSNPKFKDCDINELCTEFSNKAKCDGSKVVLEPSGVNSILNQLSMAKHGP